MIHTKVSYLIFHFFCWEPNLEMHVLHWTPEKFSFIDSYQTAELLWLMEFCFFWVVTYVFTCFIFSVVSLGLHLFILTYKRFWGDFLNVSFSLLQSCKWRKFFKLMSEQPVFCLSVCEAASILKKRKKYFHSNLLEAWNVFAVQSFCVVDVVTPLQWRFLTAVTEP